MLLLMGIILTSYAVRCDEASYYVIEMPENDIPVQYNVEKNFKIYWNVPTMQCKSKKIPFDNLFDKYGIIQNKDDRFRGEKISILYDPGLFPALLKNESSGKFVFRNGGVPQQGNLSEHISIFRDVLDQSIPDKDFDGIGIIDFESWRPVFRQNFGVLVPYKDISYELVRKEYWWWPKTWIQAEAKDMFERAARQFMQTTLSEAKQLRPRASWGYYGFPYCFNMAAHNMRERCSDKVPEENDQTYWLWLESTALYPSIYSSQELTSSQLAGLVRGRVKESTRVRKYNAPILPYFWYRYRDGGFLTEKDLQVVLRTLYQSEASGFIIWGSSNDVNTANKCIKLHDYLDNVLGPAIAKYVKTSLKLKDHINNVVNTTVVNMNITTTHNPILEADDNETKNDLDPEFHWNPPENYTQDIKKYVEEEFNKKTGHNVSHSENKTDSIFNDTALVNILLHLLLDNNTEVIKEIDESSYNELDSTTEDFKTNMSQADITESLEVDNNFMNDISTTELTDLSTQNDHGFTSTEPTTISQAYYEEIFNNNIFIDFTTELESSTLQSTTKEGTTEENSSSTGDTTNTSNNLNELPSSTATDSFRNYIDELTSTTESSPNYDVTSDLVSTTEWSTNNYTTTDVETITDDDKNTDITELLANVTETADGGDIFEELAESTLSLPSTATLDQVGGTTAVYKKPVIYFIVILCLLTL